MSSKEGKSGFFLQKNDENLISLKNNILDGIRANPELSKYDQYVNYFYKTGFSAEEYFNNRIQKLLFAKNGEWIFFYDLTSKGPYLIGVRISGWDEEHFKFKMAFLQIFTVPNEPAKTNKLGSLLQQAINYLRNEGVKFVSSRVNGDHITALHSMENVGFRYYDNVIWPITNAVIHNENPMRLISEKETDRVKWISENFQYPRGHYYCDERFEKKTINSMYPKWVETTLRNKEPIAVIESNNKVAGFFVFKIDEELYKYTGYKYGRLRLLALDSEYRGQGLGEKLFKGTLSLIKNLGIDYIDSGYSTKNHISAKLHVNASFYSVYEEVTFHLWLD